MTRYMLIDALHPEETRVAITEKNQILDFDFVTSAKQQIKGNIYLAKVTRVEPSLQAAFVEYGGNKQGFLPFSEIHPDYYQIPVSDRKKLIEEEEALAQEEANKEEREDEEYGDGDSEKSGHNKRRRRRKYKSASRNEEKIVAEDGKNTEEDTEEAIEESAEEQKDKPSNDAPDSPEETPEENEEVPTLGDDEDNIGRRRKRVHYSKRYKIQEVIKRNQVILVQVIKEERGNKGVSLSTYISLAGRHCVLMPNSSKTGGISRKISNNEDRKRLKKIIQELQTAQGMSVIVRTAGLDRTRAEIKRDFDYLVKLWNQIREDTLASTAPSLVYEESDIIKRSLRDLYNGDIDKILVEGEQAYRGAKDFMKMMMPSHAARVKQYKENVPIFSEYNVEFQLGTMYDPSVKLRSGGSIVINPTEALISIDVNSGRATAERNIEETATKTNLEAAKEIARQLRLRDLAGLVVIDFIDMMEGRNRRAIERAMRDALKFDRAKIQIGRISPFGLMELSRQRLRPSISETSYNSCPHCRGTGLVRRPASLNIEIIRALEYEASSGECDMIILRATTDILEYLFNVTRDTISHIEETHNVRIKVQSDPTLQDSSYVIDKSRPGENNKRRRERHGKDAQEKEGRRKTNAGQDTQNDETHDDTRRKKSRETTRKRGRARRVKEQEDNTDNNAEDTSEQQEKEKKKRPPRRRTTTRSKSDSKSKTAAASTGDSDVKQAVAKDEIATEESKPASKTTARGRTRKPATKKVERAKSTATSSKKKNDDKQTSSNDNHALESANAASSDTKPKIPRKGWWNRNTK